MSVSPCNKPTVRVELYGLARHRAGTAAVAVAAANVGEALAAVTSLCPGLHVLCAGTISPEYLVSLNGRRFTTNVSESLTNRDTLLILGADAGG